MIPAIADRTRSASHTVPVSDSCDSGENSVNGHPRRLRHSAWTQPPTNTLRQSARETSRGRLRGHSRTTGPLQRPVPRIYVRSRAPAPPALHEAVTPAAMCLARVKWHFRPDPQARFLSPGCDGAERPECNCRIGRLGAALRAGRGCVTAYRNEADAIA